MITESAANQFEPQSEPTATRKVWAFTSIPTWVWLAGSGALMAIIYSWAFGQRYTLADNGYKSLQSFSSLNLLSADSALLYVASFFGLFALYWFGARQKLTLTRLHWLLVGGFAVIFNLALLFMYPVDASDVYDYVVRGRMSSVYGLNPLQDTPLAIQNDPFYNFASWRDVPSAYGPAWEALAGLTTRFTGSDSFTNVVAFKLIAVAGYALTALFIGLALYRVAPQRALLGVYLFAWNPLIIFSTAGSGHNDTLMTACLAFSIYCLLRRWYVASTLGALLGALVKFIPILLIPIIALVALRELNHRLRLRYLLLSAGLGALMLIALYAPYWTGLQTLGIERRSRMFTGSVATVVRQALEPAIGEDQAVTLIKYAVLGLLGLVYLAQLSLVLSDRDPLRPVRAMAVTLMFYLMVSCIWFQAWYVLWPLSLVALLDNSPLRRLTLLFSYLVTWELFLYQYITLRYNDWAPLPWRDAVPVLIFMGLAWLYVIGYWVRRGREQISQTPLSIKIGQRLRQARETARLSISDLADELGLPTDDLIEAENGNRSLTLDRTERLCARLGLPLSTLLD